jgi:putative FmdB family regulatory protein
MPTYEYECQTCHQHVDAVQKFSDPALTTCEACGGELRKVFSAVGIVFKGSGFYKNDSRGSKTTTTPPAATPASTPAPAPATSAPASNTSTSTSTAD